MRVATLPTPGIVLPVCFIHSSHFGVCPAYANQLKESIRCMSDVSPEKQSFVPPKSVAVPGFPRGGGANTPGGVPTYDFAKISQKLHEIERIWTPRGAHIPRPPRDPPLKMLLFVSMINKTNQRLPSTTWLPNCHILNSVYSKTAKEHHHYVIRE